MLAAGGAQRTIRAVAVSLTALAAACRPVQTPLPGAPRPCAEAWASVPEADRGYSFERDPVRTPRGNEGYRRYADRLPRGGCTKTWTVLLYMEADAGDLAGPALADLRSIEASSADPAWTAASTVTADVVVQVHRRDPHEVLRLHLFRAPPAAPGDPRAGSASALASPIVEAIDEETVPLEESLLRFVSWGVERYPSDHYAVIVWGHGLGWRPASPPAAGVRYDRAGTSGGIAFDDRRGVVLDIPGLSRALGSASRARLGGRPFDLYASDACLMQSVEVAAELSASARYVVGSEQIEEDYAPLPYRAWLPILNGTAPARPVAACPTGDAACQAAAVLPSLQGALAAPSAAARDPSLPAEAGESAAPGERYTLSTIDEAALDRDLIPALRRLSTAIDAYAREDDLRRIGLQVLLGPDRGPLRGTPGFRGGTRDVGMFLDRLSAQVTREPGAAGTPGQKGVLEAVEAARSALGRAVIAASLGPRYRAPEYAGMAGVSVWLPHDEGELRARGGFFAPAAPWRASAGEASFRAFLDRIFTAPRP
jgi:hypothetical protein